MRHIASWVACVSPIHTSIITRGLRELDIKGDTQSINFPFKDGVSKLT